MKGSLLLFERPTGCGLARTLVLQCANNACRAFMELPTSEKIVCGKARFYDINRRSALAMQIIGRGRASLTKFTGNTFAAGHWASCLNLQFFSESIYYDTQQKLLTTVVNETWETVKYRKRTLEVVGHAY